MKVERASAALSRQEFKPARRDYYQPNAVTGPSRLPLHNRTSRHGGAHSIWADFPPLAPVKSYPSNATQYKGAQSIFADNLPPVPTKRRIRSFLVLSSSIDQGSVAHLRAGRYTRCVE